MLPLKHAAASFAEPVKRSGGRPRKPMQVRTGEGLLAVIAELAARDYRQKGHRPFEGPALKHASKLLLQKWDTKITAKRLGELRNTVSAAAGKGAGTPDTIVWRELLSSLSASSNPGEYLNALLSRKRAALHISE